MCFWTFFAARTLARLPGQPAHPPVTPQVAFLKQEGKDVLVVTSGAVGVGRQVRDAMYSRIPVSLFCIQRLLRQALLRQSMYATPFLHRKTVTF